MKRSLLLALAALPLAFTVPANARAPLRLGDPLFGTWQLSIKGTEFPFDGDLPFKEKNLVTVTIGPATAEGPVFAFTQAMTGFTVVPGSPQGAFPFGASSGVLYGKEILFIGDTDFGTIRGKLKINSAGLGVSFTATASNVDAFAIIDAKIKGTRVGP